MKAQVTLPIEPYRKDSKLLRVRVDFFPDPGDPLYEGCHVQAPERPLTPEEEAQLTTSRVYGAQLDCLKEILAAIPNTWGVNPIDCRKLLQPVGFTEEDLNIAADILEQILAAIPKVWRVNPINCHFFLLPLGFTQEDLDKATQERIVGLKQKMTLDAVLGHTGLHGLPPNLCQATCLPKSKGKAFLPTSEKVWTPVLVGQARDALRNREVRGKR